MENVYLAKTIDSILKKINIPKLGNHVGIKVHFGERGCVTYMDPKIVKAVYDAIIATGRKAALIESNVLYKGSRTNAKDHIETAKEHGFDFAPIDILDGEMGDEFEEVKLDSGLANPVKLGVGIKKYDSLVVISHFKGHIAAGYGGIFKNLGMGIGSRAGKLHMHADVHPSISIDECISCGKCIEGCDFKAISMNENNKAVINDSICTGCAMCIAVCPTGATKVPWGSSTNEELQKKIVDYSAGVFKLIPEEHCIFINIMEKITKDCDCMGTPQTPIMEDVGILTSDDPVALDKACLDLADEYSQGAFDKINGVDRSVQTTYAEEKGLGSREYKLIEL